MKKVLTTLFVCAMGLTALAQTNFRHISFDEALKAAKQENKLVFIGHLLAGATPVGVEVNEDEFILLLGSLQRLIE